MLRSIIFIFGLTVVTACGDTVGEQALVGGGVGAAGAAVVDADPVKGAVAGAAANIVYCQTYPDRC